MLSLSKQINSYVFFLTTCESSFKKNANGFGFFTILQILTNSVQRCTDWWSYEECMAPAFQVDKWKKTTLFILYFFEQIMDASEGKLTTSATKRIKQTNQLNLKVWDNENNK